MQSDGPALPPAPHSAAELRHALARPHRILDLVLGGPERIAASVAQAQSLALLVTLLVAGSLIFALPYGCVLGWSRCWRVALLFLGTVLICFPSLHVFGAYVGRRIAFTPHLALALVIPCVAALFSFGLFPIVWFLAATMDGVGGRVTVADLSRLMLFTSLFAGLGHLWRCLHGSGSLARNAALPVVLVAWYGLFLFIAVRLATVLELV